MEQKASAADKAAFLNARLAALKAVLDLTPDQDKFWTPLEAAVRDAAKERSGPTSFTTRQSRPAWSNYSTSLPIMSWRALRR